MPMHGLNFKKVLGLRVLRFRHQAGYTQDVLAERCGIYRTYLSRIEAGTANPSIAVVAALAAALRVPLHELLREFDETRDQDLLCERWQRRVV